MINFIPIPTLTKITTKLPNSSIFEEVPTNYDDNMTYLEFLLAVLKKLNSLVEVINSTTENINILGAETERISGLVDELNEEVANIKTLVDEALESIDNHEGRIANLEECCTEAKARLSELEDKVASLLTRVSELEIAVDAIPDMVDGKILELANTLRAEMAEAHLAIQLSIEQLRTRIEQLGNANYITVLNPETGLNDTLQNYINMLYEGSRPNALTAEEYDALQLTASEYDNKQLTAILYDTKGKLLLTATA